jgi:hypothetical protein
LHSTAPINAFVNQIDILSSKRGCLCRGYTLSLLLAIQLDICLAGLLPKGDTLPPGRCSRRPLATLLWCKPRQSKRPSSIHFGQSRNCDNLLSSFILIQTGMSIPHTIRHGSKNSDVQT